MSSPWPIHLELIIYKIIYYFISNYTFMVDELMCTSRILGDTTTQIYTYGTIIVDL